MKIEFEIPGEPQGKGRPRFSSIAGHVRARTPDKTVLYENLVKTAYVAAADGKTFSGDAMLRMSIIAWFSMPKSASRKRLEDMRCCNVRPTKKPDIDNIAKVVADSLNGIAYRDDAQIVGMTVGKYYNDTPKVTVIIEDYTAETYGMC